MRLAIFGGSFDPVHYGHLRLAEEAREAARLDKVLFMPAAVSPFRLHQPPSDSVHRLQMLRLAVQGNPCFEVSDLEVQRGGVSYTIDTVRSVRAQYPDAELYLILGTDALEGFMAWREPVRIAHECQLLVGTRPDYDLQTVLHRLPEPIRTRVQPVPMTPLGISASELRQRARDGRSLRYLTPPDVIEYIIQQRLYQEP
ncbi:MAG: nicotinate (nicotinamide) nucleotide adenylyltransferase [Fimbriimonadales bacterium]|nr:nicotinate (nicotinamide) nucleotide adenylyltransferase [Fimbriimonadales bacterium]